MQYHCHSSLCMYLSIYIHIYLISFSFIKHNHIVTRPIHILYILINIKIILNPLYLSLYVMYNVYLLSYDMLFIIIIYCCNFGSLNFFFPDNVYLLVHYFMPGTLLYFFIPSSLDQLQKHFNFSIRFTYLYIHICMYIIQANKRRKYTYMYIHILVYY